jgi:hypothetical protein
MHNRTHAGTPALIESMLLAAKLIGGSFTVPA